jgi:xanthine/uracil permease
VACVCGCTVAAPESRFERGELPNYLIINCLLSILFSSYFVHLDTLPLLSIVLGLIQGYLYCIIYVLSYLVSFPALACNSFLPVVSIIVIIIIVIIIIIIIIIIINILDSTGSGQGPVVGSYEHGNENSGSKKAGNFLTS